MVVIGSFENTCWFMNISKRQKWSWTAGILLLALAIFYPSVCVAEVSDHDMSEHTVRGDGITTATAKLTGTAINPLFGVTVLGMYHYFSTPEHLRGQLPLYDQPIVWGILLVLMLLMFFNSTICETMPILKIPLNALGDTVNKGGAVVVLPMVLHEFGQAFAPTAATALAATSEVLFPIAYAADGAVTSIGDGWMFLGWVVSLIVGIFAYAVVWVVWNVIDVIIFVLPIPLLDATLKSFRLGFATFVLGMAELFPWLGLVVALVMIFVCWRLSGWAFRLSVMGFIFATDFLLCRKPGNIEASVGVPAFITATAAKQWQCPARSYGRLRRGEDNMLFFAWRPWLIGPLREVALGQSHNFQCGSTLLYPMVLESNGKYPLFRLSPRYRRDSQAIADDLELCGWRDVSIVRSRMALLKQLFKTRGTVDSLVN